MKPPFFMQGYGGRSHALPPLSKGKTMQGIRRDTQENHGKSCNLVGSMESVNHGIAYI